MQRISFRLKNNTQLETNKNNLYSNKDQVLYFLDSGMLSYYENDYLSAIEKLTDAEKLIDEYYTKSITQNIFRLLSGYFQVAFR